MVLARRSGPSRRSRRRSRSWRKVERLQGGDPSSKRFHPKPLGTHTSAPSIGEIAGQRSWGHYAAGVVLRLLSFGPRVD
eukprot:284327-Prymnesium_polylepis.1